MKKYLTFIIAVIFSLVTNAKTIHWITFVDTTDKSFDEFGHPIGVGEIDKTGQEVLYARFVNVVNAALAEKGYTTDIQKYWDTQTSPYNCKKAIENLSCGPDDIVVFYYIGHGGRKDTNDENYIRQHPFPQMYLAQWDGSKCIPLEWVYDVLKQKGARLTLTIGMCCNSKDPDIQARTAPQFNKNYGNASYAGNQIQSIQKLFLEYKGNLIATSASPKETSVGWNFGSLGEFDLYTGCFVYLFHKLSSNGQIEWDSFFNTLGNFVPQHYSKQHPIFMSTIKSDSEPAQQQREQPRDENIKKKSQTRQNERTDEGNNVLDECFDYIIDKSVPLDKRVEMSNRLQALFTSDATIKILGQDVDYVIDKEPADVFFQRISTSRLLLKVVPVDGKFTSGNKLSEIRVREYYRK